MSDEEEGPTPAQIAVQFAILEAEANSLYKTHDYRRALSYYSKALAVKPTAYNLVHNRAECYRSLGMIAEALLDADRLLELNPNQPRGHLSKATSLYAKGDFELAMVWYIRGTRFKQEQDQLLTFQLGVERCKEAIANALSAFDAEKLRSLISQNYFTKQKFKLGFEVDAEKSKKTKKTRSILDQSRIELDQHLLGELFDDYKYLRELEVDESIKEMGDEVLNGIIANGLDYLDSRIVFWRARNPRGLPESVVESKMRQLNV